MRTECVERVATRVVAKICCVVGGVGRSSLGVERVLWIGVPPTFDTIPRQPRADRQEPLPIFARSDGAPARRVFADHLISLDFGS